MVQLLYSLKGQGEISPLDILVQSANMSADNAPIILKFLNFLQDTNEKTEKEYGLSTNEIVELGNLCELTSLKSTAIQNWVKRDIKDLIGHPELGKNIQLNRQSFF